MFMTADIPPPPTMEVVPFVETTATVHRTDWSVPYWHNPNLPGNGDPSYVPTLGAPIVIDDGGVIYEDDPRWDCRTMGNRTCGVADGRYLLFYGPEGQLIGGTPARVSVLPNDFGVSNREVGP